MKFKIKYEDETVKIVDVRLKESQGEIDGFIMAARISPSIYENSMVLSIEKVRWMYE